MQTYDESAIETHVRDQQYPHPGAWVDSIYQRRAVVSTPVKTTTLTYAAIIEQCPAREDDPATIGTFTYHTGGHLLIEAAACNYQLNLTVSNPANTANHFTVIINALPVATFTLAPGATATYDLQVALTTRQLDLTFVDADRPERTGTLTIKALTMAAQALPPHKQPWLVIASDSTVQTYTDKEFPQTGWGAVLAESLMPGGQAVATIDPSASYSHAHRYQHDDLTIVNKAIGGRSARSFIEEGKLASLAADLRPQDVLLIQWGDNDATSSRPMRYVAPDEFPQFLNDYLDTALDRGAQPVLITPPSQCRFDGDRGHIGFPAYREAIQQVAANRKVPCIDLGKHSAELLTRLGKNDGGALFLQFAPGQYPGFSEGIHDQTHFNRFGAQCLAQIVAKGVAELPGLPYHAQPVADWQLAAPAALGATIDRENHVRLRWQPVAHAEAYRLTRTNATTSQTFTALTPTFLDLEPGEDPTYSVHALTAATTGSDATITVPRVATQTETGAYIAGLNLYEIDRQTLPDAVSFSLRFTAHPHVAEYAVTLTSQSTHAVKHLGTISADEVYALHSYQAPKKGVWIAQVIGQDTQTNQRLLSKSIIV